MPYASKHFCRFGLIRLCIVIKAELKEKEICDALIIFENNIIIFSDKNCNFPNSGNICKDWSRWYRRAIHDSSKQLYGAERWIKKFRHRIFTDRACINRFIIELPDEKSMRVHRIAVAHGASARCAQYFGNGSSGTPIISPLISGDQHFIGDVDPFRIGSVNPNRGIYSCI